MNDCPGTESCTMNKGEAEECRRMITEIMAKVISIGQDGDHPCRAEDSMEALNLLNYIGMQLDVALQPDRDGGSRAAQRDLNVLRQAAADRGGAQ